jgi:hypothetical protein
MVAAAGSRTIQFSKLSGTNIPRSLQSQSPSCIPGARLCRRAQNQIDVILSVRLFENSLGALRRFSGRTAKCLICNVIHPFVVSEPALSDIEGNHERFSHGLAQQRIARFLPLTKTRSFGCRLRMTVGRSLNRGGKRGSFQTRVALLLMGEW